MKYSARSVREQRQLITSGEHTLVVLSNDDYEMFRQQIALADVKSPSSENPAMTAKPALVLAFRGTPKPKRPRRELPALVHGSSSLRENRRYLAMVTGEGA